MKNQVSAALTALALLAGIAVQATPLSITDVPLMVSAKVPPLNMIVLGRDHKLYYEAYNDASDLNGDGDLDIRYRPDKMEYYGYFDSFKCYAYNDTNKLFEPTRATTRDQTARADKKKCAVDSEWSGDFLNYLTTSRIDAIRKVLYGGYRSTDVEGNTILERSFIPQDAHSWGKEYSRDDAQYYNIADYSSLALPEVGTRHLFANTTITGSNPAYPLLRVVTNQGPIGDRPVRIWDWVSIEQPVAGGYFFHGSATKGSPPTHPISNYVVRVKVCVATMLEDNCTRYGTNYKPTGLLQEYGTNGNMLFGLMTGSNVNNLQGGVLRKKISAIGNEIDPATGVFTSTNGIIKTIDRLKVVEFRADRSYECRWNFATSQVTNGNCRMWGNPLGEIMYETVRYFSGASSPTAEYVNGISDGNDSGLALPLATWDNPYDLTANQDGRDWCSKPFMTVMSDLNQSFDSDAPGNAFNPSVSNTLTGFDPASLAQTIWSREFGAGSKQVFVGEIAGGTAAQRDKNPTAKTVSTLGNIRGLAPEEPTREGSYYTASIAAYARTHDINPIQKDQKIQTFAVALASPLPRIQVPVGNGKTVTVIPFAKSVGGSAGGPAISAAAGSFQPTNQIVDFYVESIQDTPTLYKAVFQINFEDVENGGDHDMDAIAKYTITADKTDTEGRVEIEVKSIYAAGSIAQHMGYILSGTADNEDGVHLVVRDCDTASTSVQAPCTNNGDNPNADPDYYLDDPNVAGPLPFSSTQTFKAGTSASGEFLKPPLWFAAKYGGYRNEDVGSALPDLATTAGKLRWDEDNNGEPDNYFLVVNPLKLKEQLKKAFDDILDASASASGVAASSTSLRSDSQLFQAKFSSTKWTGSLTAFRVNANGSVGDAIWTTDSYLRTTGDNSGRRIFTTKRGTGVTPVGVEFTWTDLGDTQKAALNISPVSATDDGRGQDRLNFVRGNRDLEGSVFRERGDNTLGDIVYSSPKYVSKPSDLYEDSTYLTFRNTYANRKKVVYVGANDGMLHAFDATLNANGTPITGSSGKELFAYIPSELVGNLNKLTSKTYTHQFYVDGSPSVKDVQLTAGWKTVLVGGLNKGGKTVYALDVSDPGNFSAANVMWEFTSADDADLGYTYSQPKIVKLNNDKWAAIFGNGYNSPDEKAVLYIVYLDGPGDDKAWSRAQSNPEYIKIDTGWSTGSNGISGVTPIDIDVDGKVDFVYAGDLRGNIWKFDLTATAHTSWAPAFGSNVPLFTATDSSGVRQPITTEPTVALHPVAYGSVKVTQLATPQSGAKLRGTMVYFGTGAFLETCDASSTCPSRSNSQSFYGVWDDNVAVTGGRSVLLNQTFANVSTHELSNLPVDWKRQSGGSHMGWYIDLTTSERVINPAYVISGKVIYSTIKPSGEVCDGGGKTWLMCSKYENGGKCRGMDNISFNTLQLGGITLLNNSNSSGLRRIDESLSSQASTTRAYTSDSLGNLTSTELPNLDTMRVRLVNWRELINE